MSKNNYRLYECEIGTRHIMTITILLSPYRGTVCISNGTSLTFTSKGIFGSGTYYSQNGRWYCIGVDRKNRKTKPPPDTSSWAVIDVVPSWASAQMYSPDDGSTSTTTSWSDQTD